MTSHIKAVVTYNYPITITKDDKIVFKSEGEPQSYIGEHIYELNESFSGSTVIKVTETPKPEIQHNPV